MEIIPLFRWKELLKLLRKKSFQLFLTLWALIKINAINSLHDQNLKESQIPLENRFISFLLFIIQRITKTSECVRIGCDDVLPFSAAIIKDLVDKLFHKDILQQYYSNTSSKGSQLWKYPWVFVSICYSGTLYPGRYTVQSIAKVWSVWIGYICK